MWPSTVRTETLSRSAIALLVKPSATITPISNSRSVSGSGLSTRAKAGVVLNPGTPVETLDNLMDLADLILVMSVNPGFGGQSFIASQLKKIEAVATRIAASGRPIELEVDGGVNPETARSCVAAGANVLVAGSAVFKGGETAYAGNIGALRG